MEYRRGTHTVFEIHLHLVWITKYRRPALTGETAPRVRDLIRDICGQHEVSIMKGHVSKDHVHLLISLPPQVTISRLMQWLKGRTAHHLLAELRDPRVKASEEEIARSLARNWQGDFLFELQQAVNEYDLRQKQLAECDQRLQAYLGALPTRPSPATDEPDPEPTPSALPAKRKKRKNPSTKAPKSFPLGAKLSRICGVDATRIDGVDVMTIMTVVAELGVDLEARRPRENHFTSWLNLSPNRDISGGKVIRQNNPPARKFVGQFSGNI